MLDHVQDMGQSCSPHEGGFGYDEGQPEGPDPESKETNQSDANGGKTQLHLETAVQRPADPCGNLVCIDDMPKQATHDREPASQANSINGDDLYRAFLAFLVPGGKQMNGDGYDRDRDL